MKKEFFILILLSILSVSVSGSECRRAAGFDDLYVIGNALWVDDAGLWRSVPGTYYQDARNHVFDHRGYPIVAYRGAGGLIPGTVITTDAASALRYYPQLGVSVQRGEGFARVGVGYDGYLYYDGERCANLGDGFYFHRGHVYDSRGAKVIEVHKNGSRFSYVYQR